MIWTFGGTSLSDFGTVTVLEDYLDAPERRGDNLLVPFRHGRVYVEKYYEQRVMTFGLAINEASIAALESTLDDLKALIGIAGQQTLSAEFGDATTRAALAEVRAPLSIKRFSPTFAKVAIDFTLADPFLYSTSLTTESDTVDASPLAMNVTNAGTVAAYNPTIELTGPLENTEITNSTNGVSVKYTGVIAAPRVVTIQEVSGEIICTDDLANNLVGNVTHSGDAALMVFDPGVNELSITDDEASTGEIEITFYAPYM